jgi:hypothetical protein
MRHGNAQAQRITWTVRQTLSHHSASLSAEWMCGLSATTSIQNSDWHYDRMQAEQSSARNARPRPRANRRARSAAQRSAKRAAAKGRAQ